jgi:hypothetical protein
MFGLVVMTFFSLQRHMTSLHANQTNKIRACLFKTQVFLRHPAHGYFVPTKYTNSSKAKLGKYHPNLGSLGNTTKRKNHVFFPSKTHEKQTGQKNVCFSRK